MARRIILVVCPSIFLLLYLVLTDEGQGGPAAAVASLSAANEDLSSLDDMIYNRPPVVYNFSVMDLDKRYNFSTGK